MPRQKRTLSSVPSASAVKRRRRTPSTFSCCGPTLEASTASSVVNAAAPARPTTTTASHESTQAQDFHAPEGSQAGRHIAVSSSVPFGIGLGLGRSSPSHASRPSCSASVGSPLVTYTNTRGPSNSGVEPISSITIIFYHERSGKGLTLIFRFCYKTAQQLSLPDQIQNHN